MPNHVSRELVITVPIPDDKGRSGDGRPKVRASAATGWSLAGRLVEFRARHGITQAEVAAVVDAGNASTVAQWESGANIPRVSGREHLIELLDGQR